MISACLPRQLVSVSNITTITTLKLLTLLSSSGHVIYFLEGRSLKAGTYFSNSFNSCGVTTAFCNRSESRVSVISYTDHSPFLGNVS